MNRAQRRAAPRPTIALVYVHPGEVSAVFAYSMVAVSLYETGRTGVPPALIAQRCGANRLVEARNDAARYVIDETDCEWFFSIDSDMGFGPDTIARLIADADPITRPVVGALCFALKRQGADNPANGAVTFRMHPTLYQLGEDADRVGFRIVTDYPRDQLVQVAGTGAACVLIHRTVLEKVRAEHGDHWFDQMTHPQGTTFSEDLSFMLRVQACGYPVYVDTAVKTSHDKGGVFLTEERWDEQEALRKLTEAAA